MSKPPPPTFEQLRAMTGEEVGVSDWIVVDQDRIDRFADCTEDRQWLHVDPQRARRESPFRDTIAHGYLSLSLIGGLCQQMNVVPENTQAVSLGCPCAVSGPGGRRARQDAGQWYRWRTGGSPV